MYQQNSASGKGVDSAIVWMYITLVVIGILSIFAATYRDGDNVLQGFLSL